MGVKYNIPFKDYDNVPWQVQILTNAYLGSPIQLRAVSKSIILSKDGDTDDPFTVLIKSTFSITVYNQEDNIDINELQLSQDRDFVVRVYKNTSLQFEGYLQTEGIQRKLSSSPNEVALTAICGLAMLSDIDYKDAELDGGRSIINYLRQILFSKSNLGLPLPLRWTNNVECTAFLTEDAFSGSVRWATDGQGFYSFQSGQFGDDEGPVKKCGEILEGMLRAFQCRIYQENGRWIIRRITDFVQGTISYKQIPGDLNPLIITGGIENITKQIGRYGYQMILEDQISTTKQGLKSCKVTYEANIRENILPNGSQDYVVKTPGSNDRVKSWGFYDDLTAFDTVEQPLDNRTGHSALISKTSPGPASKYTNVVTGGSYGVNGLPIDTLTLVKTLNFGFTFSLQSGFLTDIDNTIIWTGFPLNVQVIFNLGSDTYYLNQYGFWQSEEVVIPIVVEGLKLNEVAKINFDKFQGIIMPTNNIQPGAGYTSNIIVTMLVENGQRYYVDNIYLSLDKSNDVYESIFQLTKNTSTEERSLKISSSFGGYMVSNFMTSWDQSGNECFFKDGLVYTGTLTGLTANAIMRFRYKPSKIFNGTVSTRGNNWSFDQIFLIDVFGTEKYLPLNARYNIETCECTLVAIESRNDAIELTEKYYGSNDNQLSN